MQKLPVLVACLLVVGILPTGSGQAEADPILFDNNGDVTLAVADTPQDAPGGLFDHIDLVNAWLEEDAAGFWASVQSASFYGPGNGNGEVPTFWSLHFRHNDMQFQVTFFRFCFVVGCDQSMFAIIDGRADGTTEWSRLMTASLQDGSVVVDEGQAIMSVHIPRDLLADTQGAAPFPGRELDNLWAESGLASNEFAIPNFLQGGGDLVTFPVKAWDRMPDAGMSPDGIPVVFGLQQSGDALLRSDEPYRASNGEETTYVYQINATNIGETEHVFQFRTVGAPGNWDIRFPIPTLVLGPGEDSTVPVLVSTPFAHQHGGAQGFTVEMFAVDDSASVGRVEIGIRFLEIPQPAGHHDTVFIHSFVSEPDNPFETAFQQFGEGIRGYMNADPDDEQNAGVPIPGDTARENEAGSVGYRWEIPLNPGLRLGLDGNLLGTGSITLPISSQTPLPAATITATLGVTGPQPDFRRDQERPDPDPVWGWRSDPVTLFTTTWGPIEFAANQREVLEAPIQLDSAADYIQYDVAQNMVLIVTMKATGVSTFFVPQDNPMLEPGGSMTLPLFEYTDPVDEAFGTLSGPILEIRGEQERKINPGGVALFEVDIIDQGNAGGKYRMHFSGSQTPWASLLGKDTVELNNDKKQTTVKIQVPPGAQDGTKADMFLEVVHMDDPTRRGLVRMVVEVDTDEQHDDDSAQALAIEGEVQDSPATGGIAVAFVLALFGALFIGRRRH